MKKYIYNEIYLKKSLRYQKIRNDYYKALEISIINNGPSNTIKEFDDYLNNKEEKINRESLSILSEYKKENIIKLLNFDLGTEKTLSNKIKNTIDIYFTNKYNILKEAIGRTYERYDINQAKLAFRTYYKDSDASLFTRSTKDQAGRGTIVKEIPIDIIKYLIGIKKTIELGFLIDDYKNEYSISKHITCLDKLTETILNEYINKKDK